MQALQVGVGDRWHVTTAGAPLGELAVIEKHAQPGEVVASAQAWALIHDRCLDAARGDGCYRVDRVDGGPIRAAPKPLLDATGPDDALPYLPSPIRTRLADGHAEWLSELRRITAVFVNLVDFDHASQEALGRLQSIAAAALRIFDEYEGFLQSIVVDDKGIGLIGVFGVPPRSHEDDPVRALRAARDLADALSRSGYRTGVGVATGRAFCGVVGNEIRREYSIVGDVVNIAARLMAAAPYALVCDAPTAEAASPRLSFETLPKLTLKGKTEPVAVFLPTSEQPGFLVRHEVMVGRTFEQAAIRAALDAIVEQDSTRVLVFEGEAGIGKSRLLGEALRQAQDRGLPCWSRAPDAIAASLPYNGWRSVFGQIFGLQGITDPAARRLRVEHLLGPELRERAPLLNALLALNLPENSLTQQMTAEVRSENTRSLLTAMISKTINGSPHVILIEDAHWLDSLSWALILDVVQRLHPILLVIAARPIVETETANFVQLVARKETTRLMVSALSSQDTLALICARLQVARLADPVMEFILDRAKGHPLYSEELAYTLRDRKAVVIVGDECQFAPGVDLASIDFPDTLTGLITSRIDLLSSQAALTLKVASVVGLSFTVQLVRDVYPIGADQPKIPGYLTEVEHLDFTKQDVGQSGQAYVFRHMIVQEASYSLLLFQQRRMIHLSVAEWYERHAEDLGAIYSILAYHWSRAGDVGKAVSIRACGRASPAELREPGSGHVLQPGAKTDRGRPDSSRCGATGALGPASGRSARQSGQVRGRPETPRVRLVGHGIRAAAVGRRSRRRDPPTSGEAGRPPRMAQPLCRREGRRPRPPARNGQSRDTARGNLLLFKRPAPDAPCHCAEPQHRRGGRIVAATCGELFGFRPDARRGYGSSDRAGLFATRPRHVRGEENAASRSWTWVASSCYYLGQGDFSQALDLNQRVAALATRTGDFRRWCDATWNFARIAYFGGDFEGGLAHSEKLYEAAAQRRFVRSHIAGQPSRPQGNSILAVSQTLRNRSGKRASSTQTIRRFRIWRFP